ncbi:MAG: transposase [Bacteroidales bacterium]|nr:transposase [Bacteroidales bacterium]
MKNIELKDLFSGNCYHVCTNGQETPTIIMDKEDFKVAHNYLALAGWKTGIEILAFVIMSNHVHIIIICKDRNQAVRYIRSFKKLYSMYLSMKYDMSEALRGIEDSISLIDSISYFRNCVAYILRNALCARICKRIEDYPWSSYPCYFNMLAHEDAGSISDLGIRERRMVLKTRMDLSECPYLVNSEGMIEAKSFVRYDIVEKAFVNSGKFFLASLGTCNDAKMEYEMTCKPLVRVNDKELAEVIEALTEKRFEGKKISGLTQSQKCSIIKNIYFNNKTTIPQLSRILGLSKGLIKQILST